MIHIIFYSIISTFLCIICLSKLNYEENPDRLTKCQRMALLCWTQIASMHAVLDQWASYLSFTMKTEYKSLHSHATKSLIVRKKDLLLKLRSGGQQNFNARQRCQIGFISTFKSQVYLCSNVLYYLDNRLANQNLQIYGKFDFKTGIKMDRTRLKNLVVLFC